MHIGAIGSLQRSLVRHRSSLSNRGLNLPGIGLHEARVRLRQKAAPDLVSIEQGHFATARRGWCRFAVGRANLSVQSDPIHTQTCLPGFRPFAGCLGIAL